MALLEAAPPAQGTVSSLFSHSGSPCSPRSTSCSSSRVWGAFQGRGGGVPALRMPPAWTGQD